MEQAQQPKWAKMLSESHVDDDDSDHSDSGDGLGIKVTWKSLGYLIEYALHSRYFQQLPHQMAA